MWLHIFSMHNSATIWYDPLTHRVSTSPCLYYGRLLIKLFSLLLRLQELYHQSYAKVGVIFASVPNFNEFYTEMDGSDQGLECLRLLNEIIADFDELLKEDRFRGIDKIKTVGSTYMAVVGLIPEYKIQPNDPNSVRRHMTALIEYVKAMRLSLQEINSHSYNNFMLRVGKFT